MTNGALKLAKTQSKMTNGALKLVTFAGAFFRFPGKFNNQWNQIADRPCCAQEPSQIHVKHAEAR
jgi:hypothetical protein